MKIAFDHQTFTHQAYGGISRYYATLAYELSLLKEDTCIFAGLHRNNYLSGLPSENVRGVNVGNYPPKTWKPFYLLNHVLTQVQINSWGADIVHETYYSSLPTLGSKVMRVTTAHDMIHEIFRDNFPANDRTTDYKKRAFERVDHIISISHSTKRDLVKYFDVEESKISVVHHGVDVVKYQADSDYETRQRPFFLYVGARGGYKNFCSVLRAIAGSRSLKTEFDLIAFGGGRFSSEETALMAELGFTESQVEQVSGGDDTLVGLYRQAEALIYPSLYEGFGLPPLEAMAAGCPVICSNNSSIPEVVNHAGEYFDPMDYESIARAIENVARSSELKLKLIQAGFDNVNKFSWTNCAQETMSIYNKLVDANE
jgi:glycosyltransferase involved in cell wall biosynthesis